MNEISQGKVSAGLVERGVLFLAVSLFFTSWPGFANESRVVFANLASTFEVSAQWRCPSAPGAGYDTVEIFLENTGSRPITFKNVTWNGANLAFQTGRFYLDPQSSTISPKVTWWQFYPSGQVMPNEAVVLRVNFQRAPGTEQRLMLTDSAGHSMAISVPPFSVPAKLITAITYTLNYDRVFIQFQAGETTVQQARLNGREISAFKLLKSAAPGSPDMLAFAPPFAITTGQPLHVKLQLSDGTSIQALVRALNGIMLDAYSIGARERVEVGLDPDPAVCNFTSVDGGDVACYDTSKGKAGSAAPLLIKEHLDTLEKQKHKLMAIHYCTAAYTAMGNLYGAIADVAFANPYCLGYFPDKSRFIDKEDSFLKRGWKSARPSPFLWIPEAFNSKSRFLEPGEIQVLAWTALVRGCKGIKYFTYGGKIGFGSCPLLLAAIKELNGQIREKQGELSSLALVSEEILGDAQTGVKVYTAWAGDSGMLVLLRNLDYQTDDWANNLGQNPRFKARSKDGLIVPLVIPEWLVYREARDFLTDTPIAAVQQDRNLSINLDRLDAFKLLWLANNR